MVPTDTSPSVPRKGHGTWRRLLTVAACFFFGAGASWLTKRVTLIPSETGESPAQTSGDATPPRPDATGPNSVQTSEVTTEKHPTEQTGDPLESLMILLCTGQYEQVLQQCEHSEADAYETLLAKGLALEGLGRWDEAAAAYEQLIKQHPGDWQVQLGRVRCALAKREWETARRVRAGVLLRSGPYDRRALQECLMLRAQEVYRQQGRITPLDPLNSEQWAWPADRPAHDRLCEWLLQERGQTEKRRWTDIPWGTLRWEEPRSEGVVEPAVTIRWPEASVGEHIRRLCAALGWEVQVENGCGKELETLRMPLEVSSVPVSEVLSALVDAVGAGWQRQGWNCVIRRERVEAAEAVYRRAWEWCGEHPWLNGLRLVLAWERREWAEGEWSRRLYRQVQEDGLLEERAVALYNAALLEWRWGRWGAARARFYDLLDLIPGHAWEQRARWWLGRTALEHGDLVGAEQHWRAVASSGEAEWSAAASLGLLLIAALKEDNATLRLRLAQRLPAREPYLAWSDLFEAWLDYNRQPTPSRAERVADALLRTRECAAFDTAGTYWAGQVWLRVGQPERMVLCYEQAVRPGPSPWLLKMWDAVARYYHGLGLFEQSRQRDLALLAADPQGLGQRAALRLAEAALQQGRVSQCLQYVQSLRQTADPTTYRSALHLLGQAYERLGHYRAAAECFVGRWPEPSVAQPSSR